MTPVTIEAELRRDTDLSPRHCAAAARVIASRPQCVMSDDATAEIHRRSDSNIAAPRLSQRNQEVMRAYNGVINDDTASGRAARHVRDTLLARQSVSDLTGSLNTAADQLARDEAEHGARRECAFATIERSTRLELVALGYVDAPTDVRGAI